MKQKVNEQNVSEDKMYRASGDGQGCPGKGVPREDIRRKGVRTGMSEQGCPKQGCPNKGCKPGCPKKCAGSKGGAKQGCPKQRSLKQGVSNNEAVTGVSEASVGDATLYEPDFPDKCVRRKSVRQKDGLLNTSRSPRGPLTCF